MKRLVPMFPWPVHPQIVKQIESLGEYSIVEALPGGPAPVLAIRKPPTFACDAIVVNDPQRLADALHVVASEGLEFVGMADILGRAFTRPVVELEPEKNVSRVSFK